LPTLPRLLAESLDRHGQKDSKPEFELLKQVLFEERRKRRQLWGALLFLGGFLIGALFVLARIHSI
jgi:hypothetical protein